jgi:hypothetical protein
MVERSTDLFGYLVRTPLEPALLNRTVSRGPITLAASSSSGFAAAAATGAWLSDGGLVGEDDAG